MNKFLLITALLCYASINNATAQVINDPIGARSTAMGGITIRAMITRKSRLRPPNG